MHLRVNDFFIKNNHGKIKLLLKSHVGNQCIGTLSIEIDALVPAFSIQFYIIYKVHRCAYQLDRF